MRLALVVGLLVAEFAAGAPRIYNRNCDVASRRSTRGGVDCPAAYVDGGDPFSSVFAPADGTGLGAACDCADVTAADGTPAAFLRDTAQSCTKHHWWRNIQPGDVVSCPVNKPVIEPGGDGTGQLRYLAEPSGANYVKSSEDFLAGTWALYNAGGAAACTLSPPDAGLSPRGDNTATRLRCPATAGGGERNQIYNDDVVPATPASGSIYVRSYGAANTVQTSYYDSTTNFIVNCAPGAFDAGYSRCVKENVAAGIISMGVGHIDSSIAHAATDVLIWGADTEPYKAVTSYIYSGGSTGTRGSSSLAIPVPVAQGTDLTVAAAFMGHAAPTFGGYITSLSLTGGGGSWAFENVLGTVGANFGCRIANGGTESFATVLSAFNLDAVNTTTCNFDGNNRMGACLNGSCVDAGVTVNPSDFDTLWVGTLITGGSQPNGHIGPVTISSSARKDIYLYGDGVVDGFPTYQALPQNIVHAAKGNSVSIQNNATTGDRIEDCDEEWTRDVAEIRASGHGRGLRSYMMVQCGINGMRDGGTDAGQVTDIVRRMVLDARDAGIHVLVSSVTPFPALPAAVPYINTINANNLAMCTELGVAYADTFTALGGPGCDPLLLQCADGGVHLQDAGQVVETNLWIQRGGW